MEGHDLAFPIVGGLILGVLFLQPSFLVRVETFRNVHYLVKQDQNRYSASRGAHLNLKRAEKARVLVSKIPAMMSTVCLLLRQEREDEKRRLREQKKVQEQPHVEQDTAFSTRPSPARPVSAKKPVGARASNGGANGTPNRRLSLNANQNGSRQMEKNVASSMHT
ncbi:hypothetical protein Bca4012_077746 [Brassica carinata]